MLDMARTLLFAALLSVAVALPSAALAAGSDSSEPPAPTPTTTKCKKKEVWDEKKRKCIEAKKSSGLSDDTLYAAARELAYAKRYSEAQYMLSLAANQNDPRILNYYGFTTRKLGDVEEGLRYYRAALNIDPDYILARSYMGEALALTGDVEGAKAQLKQIAVRGGRVSYAYRALETVIKTGQPTY
jgi:tetratricopeptide (TPR) repeat protein